MAGVDLANSRFSASSVYQKYVFLGSPHPSSTGSFALNLHTRTQAQKIGHLRTG